MIDSSMNCFLCFNIFSWIKQPEITKKFSKQFKLREHLIMASFEELSQDCIIFKIDKLDETIIFSGEKRLMYAERNIHALFIFLIMKV
jgi:hypothetical protein